MRRQALRVAGDAMFVLALGIVLFAAIHLLPAIPAAKERVKALTGEKAYGALFGAASVVALLLIVWGWRISDFVAVYDPPSPRLHSLQQTDSLEKLETPRLVEQPVANFGQRYRRIF